MARQGPEPKFPDINVKQEDRATALCGSWEPGHRNASAPICWNHCRPRMRGKTYCAEAAREVTNQC